MQLLLFKPAANSFDDTTIAIAIIIIVVVIRRVMYDYSFDRLSRIAIIMPPWSRKINVDKLTLYNICTVDIYIEKYIEYIPHAMKLLNSFNINAVTAHQFYGSQRCMAKIWNTLKIQLLLILKHYLSSNIPLL